MFSTDKSKNQTKSLKLLITKASTLPKLNHIFTNLKSILFHHSLDTCSDKTPKVFGSGVL